MAGAQHASVTGMDERTLGRIDLILFDADYRDAKAAVEDSWRVAVMASDPRTRASYERVRAAAVGAANARRDPTGPRVPTSTTWHRVALAAALVAGVVSVALLCWLEPRRANGSLWGSRVPAGIHLAFGAAWILAAAAVFVLRWSEVGTFAALPAISGLTLLGSAGLVALILCGYALRADRSGRQTGVARVTGDLLEQADAPEVFDALDLWWSTAGPDAMKRSARRVRTVRREVLARLKAAMLITEREELVALYTPDPVKWTARRR